jgi:hypothetical protein
VPEIMGQVMAERFAKSFQRPERARNVTPAPTRPDVRDEPTPDGPPRVLRPVEPPEMPHMDGSANGASVVERARVTAVLALALLAVGMRGLVGV